MSVPDHVNLDQLNAPTYSHCRQYNSSKIFKRSRTLIKMSYDETKWLLTVAIYYFYCPLPLLSNSHIGHNYIAVVNTDKVWTRYEDLVRMWNFPNKRFYLSSLWRVWAMWRESGVLLRRWFRTIKLLLNFNWTNKVEWYVDISRVN